MWKILATDADISHFPRLNNTDGGVGRDDARTGFKATSMSEEDLVEWPLSQNSLSEHQPDNSLLFEE